MFRGWLEDEPKFVFGPDVILCGWLGLGHQLTNITASITSCDLETCSVHAMAVTNESAPVAHACRDAFFLTPSKCVVSSCMFDKTSQDTTRQDKARKDKTRPKNNT